MENTSFLIGGQKLIDGLIFDNQAKQPLNLIKYIDSFAKTLYTYILTTHYFI